LTLNKSEIIGEICSADTLLESLDLFNQYSDVLKTCKFIFASKSGGVPGFSVNRDFSDGSVVRSLFNSSSILVLDDKILEEMKTGRATYLLDYSISLDTQTLSYLEPYINGKTNRLPEDFEEIFSFIAREDVNVDPLPYLQENIFNLSDDKKAKRIFEKLKAYEILRSLDERALREDKTVKSTLSEMELLKNTQEHISRMYRDLENSKLVSEINFNFNFEYWHLLAMISIKLDRKKSSVDEQLLDFLEICDKKIATLSLREISVAKEYFEKGQDLTFFGKVQKGKKDLFSVVKGMAWDMWHIRQMEKNLTIRPAREARYFFPSLLTCDKRLVDVIDLYPLKACAYDEQDSIPLPFYDGDWLQSISSSEDIKDKVYSKYFSRSAVISRNSRREEVKEIIGVSVSELEKQVSCLCSVEIDEVCA
jgi:hypothetical protein